MLKILREVIRYYEIKNETSEINTVLDFADFSKVVNERPNSISSVVMVIPDIHPNLGGITSALRILTSLEDKGCEVTLACYSAMDKKIAERNAKVCMPQFYGKVKNIKECYDQKYDICIATSWKSTFYAKRISGYKIYFVQDYEPAFYGVGDLSVLAKTTYGLGFHIISLGKWNIDQIKKNSLCIDDIYMNYVDFPYEPKEYPYTDRSYMDYKKKKRIQLACYIKFSGRRIPYIIEYILSKSYAELGKRGIELDVMFFGIDKRNEVPVGKNMGKLSRKELNNLYRKSDFGMVASMTNISLVPYEMLASGLPLIEFKDGSYKDFMDEDTALLIDYNYMTLVNGILDFIDNPYKLEMMHNKAYEQLKELSWKKTCNQFWDIICGLKEN